MAASSSVNQDEFFTYDGLKLLKTADRGDLNGGKTALSTLTFAQDWDQDQLANWTSFTQDNDGNGTNDLSQTRTHNDVNEITQVDSSATHVAHDAAGNMTKAPTPASWSAHYDLTWDAWNRLVKVTNVGDTVAEYQYDGQNRRIVKKLYSGGSLSQTRHIYLSIKNQVLEERVDSSASADRQFTWGSRYIDDLVLRTRDTDANGSLDETLYALQDANWNITALTDTSGTVIERFAYTPYGQSTVLDANFTADSDGISDVGLEYRFTSREFDNETTLHYFRARYYHDGLGRFIGRDPLVYQDGYNTYAGWLAGQRLDPSGKALPVIIGGGIILIGGATFWKGYYTDWDYLDDTEQSSINTTLTGMSNCAPANDPAMKQALKRCGPLIWGKWESGRSEGASADGGGPADTVTIDPGFAWRTRIYLKNSFFSDPPCEQQRVLLKECYLRASLRNFDDTGAADTKNDKMFNGMECCLGCCGTITPANGKNGPNGCCPKDDCGGE